MSAPATATTANPAPPANVNPAQGKDNNAWHEFDILAAVVSRYQNAAPKKPQSPEHRISCHRCGNIRKRRILCTRSSCPHTFCGRCAEKMKEEHGLDVFFGGCPVCKELCCCNNKSVFCHRKNHCYRKCPATKTNGKQSCAAVKEDSDSEQYHEEHASIPKPENGQYGIFDLLAAVADMDKSQALGKNGKSAAGGAAGSSSSGPRKKAKVAKDSALGGKDIYPSNMLLCEPTSYSQYFSSSVPESVGNMQILNSKGGLAGDSGVDGYTFNNNTMGIIRGGMNGMSGVADAITLMGQQNQQQKQKFNVGMDKINLMATTDPLLSTLGSSISVPAGASSGSSSNNSVLPTSSSSSSAALANAYNRLPSIDSNPFASAAVRDTQPTATFDQALLDSMRNLQDPYSMSRPLPSVPRSLPAQSAAAASSATAVAAGARSTVSATTASEKKPAVSAAALEPMNLLALVSSFTSSLDKSTHPVPAEHLLLGAASAAAAAGTSASQQGSTDAEAKN